MRPLIWAQRPGVAADTDEPAGFLRQATHNAQTSMGISDGCSVLKDTLVFLSAPHEGWRLLVHKSKRRRKTSIARAHRTMPTRPHTHTARIVGAAASPYARRSLTRALVAPREYLLGVAP